MSADFYWCPSGCNCWHRRGSDNFAHFSMPVQAPEEPSSDNFPGTAEERRHFVAHLRVREEMAADAAFYEESRVTRFLNRATDTE